MTSQNRGRTRPEVSQLDPPSKTFSTNVEGQFRGRTAEYEQTAQYPAMPLYAMNAIVYLQTQGQTQPAGPYYVSAFENGWYRIKKCENHEEHSEWVSETSLRVLVSTT